MIYPNLGKQYASEVNASSKIKHLGIRSRASQREEASSERVNRLMRYIAALDEQKQTVAAKPTAK